MSHVRNGVRSVVALLQHDTNFFNYQIFDRPAHGDKTRCNKVARMKRSGIRGTSRKNPRIALHPGYVACARQARWNSSCAMRGDVRRVYEFAFLFGEPCRRWATQCPLSRHPPEPTMQPHQALGVAIRVIGLLTVVASLLWLLSAVIVLFMPNYRADVAPAWHYLLSGVIALVLGLYLLRGARHVVAFAYPGSEEKG